MARENHDWLGDVLHPLRGLNREQRAAFWASFLGWTLDAFDFFILIFVIPDIAAEFHCKVSDVSKAVTLTLACRPLGALLFGLMADRFGRRPTLMINVVFYSLMEAVSGFSNGLTMLIVCRALYGIGMGGEWGVGASLAMESVPPKKRGVLSGLLQEGYVVGNILAGFLFFLVYDRFHTMWHLDWRYMFFIGLLPAPVVMVMRAYVKEPEAWEHAKKSSAGLWVTIRDNWRIFGYLILLMTAFNFLSHGTQDIYPTFLRAKPWGLNPWQVFRMTIMAGAGGVLGGMVFGALSERLGRRRAVVLAALLALPVLPLWAFAGSLVWLAVGVFLMQFMVQGAWGVIPAHLNELSPPAVRGTFPGFTYQLGNLFASGNLLIQTRLAEHLDFNYAKAMALVTVVVLLVVAVVTGFGMEAHGRSFVEAHDIDVIMPEG